jgi:hypothetical protein
VRRIIPLALLALSACQTTRYATVHCLSREQLAELQKQKPEKIKSRLTGKADEDVRIISGRLIRVEAYADGLIDILGGCTSN